MKYRQKNIDNNPLMKYRRSFSVGGRYTAAKKSKGDGEQRWYKVASTLGKHHPIDMMVLPKGRS